MNFFRKLFLRARLKAIDLKICALNHSISMATLDRLTAEQERAQISNELLVIESRCPGPKWRAIP